MACTCAPALGLVFNTELPLCSANPWALVRSPVHHALADRQAVTASGPARITLWSDIRNRHAKLWATMPHEEINRDGNLKHEGESIRQVVV